MQFTVSSGELLKHLASIHNVVPTKAVLPAIQNVNFELKGNILKLTGTDLENTIQTSLTVDAPADSDFAVALPHKIVQDTLKAMAEQPVRFTGKVEQGKQNETYVSEVQIKTDNGTYRITGIDGRQFPQMPVSEGADPLNIPMDILVGAIQSTVFAATTDELKPVMTGVLFNLEPNSATFVATDAHRLVRYRRSDLSFPREMKSIIPARSLRLLLSASALAPNEMVRVEFTDRNVFFRINQLTIVCRQIEGNFPDYNAVIPVSSPNKVIINRKDLANTIKRLQNYASKTTHMGRFKLTGNLMEVKAYDQEQVHEGTEKLTCLYEGEDQEIGFNISLMEDLVNNVQTEEIVIEMGNPGRAAVLIPGEQENNTNLLMLLMPVMLMNY
jgi:DNA polymerase-3 subunit beta